MPFRRPRGVGMNLINLIRDLGKGFVIRLSGEEESGFVH